MSHSSEQPNQAISGVGLETRYNLIEVCLGANIDDDTTVRLIADRSRALALVGLDSRLLLDVRHKSFATLNAQRQLSSGAFQRAKFPDIAHFALWTTDDQLVRTRTYAPPAFTCFARPDDHAAPTWIADRHAHNRRSVHLIAGSTGAGKSRYSLRLAADIGAMYFAIDDWMERLFGPDRPADAGFPWYMERIERCEEQIWQLARAAHQLTTPSILDLGLTTRTHRQRLLAWARNDGIPARLHYIDVPGERRWTRVVARNQARGATYRLDVNRDMFDFVEDMFEEPTPDECADFVHWWG